MTKQNNCLPARIYGGDFKQTIYMGLSIMSFSTQVGLNGQSSEFTVQLVNDTDTCNTKVYYDSNFDEQVWTGADPGFIEPQVGSPSYFRAGDFEYMGIVSMWEKSDDRGGRDIYTVKLTDPGFILDGVEIITGDYAGNVMSMPNIINAYGYAESFGKSAPYTYSGGSYFGSPANAFGGSSETENGMPFNYMIQAVTQLTSSIPAISNDFSTWGRIIYNGSLPQQWNYGTPDSTFYPSFSGYVSEYLIDLTALPTAPTYYAVPGPSVSLLEAIKMVCEDAGCDFYIELVPVLFGSQILKFITVRTLVRTNQPDLGVIDEFIGNGDGLIASSSGYELRNDTTAMLLAGGQQENIYQSYGVSPYFGLDTFGNINQPVYTSATEFYIPLDIRKLKQDLGFTWAYDYVNLYGKEMRAAIMGQDSFEAVAYANTDPASFGPLLAAAVGSPAINLSNIVDAYNSFDDTGAAAPAHVMLAPHFGSPRNMDEKAIGGALFAFVTDFVNEYYGKKFIVSIPYTCAIRNQSTGYIQTTETPTESGWTEFSTVLGLANPLQTALFMEDTNNKIKPIVAFYNDCYTLEDPSNTKYIESNGYLYLEAQVEPDVVFVNKNTLYGPYAVVTLSDAVYGCSNSSQEANQGIAFDYLREQLGGGFDETRTKQFLDSSLAREYSYLSIKQDALTPVASAIPLQSTVSTYGPWSYARIAGTTKFEKDDGLVPWEYGSISAMSTAGQDRVVLAASNMLTSESGRITVPGFPAISLGAELLTGASSVFATRQIVLGTNLLSQQRIYNKGNWNAATNTPPLSDGSGDAGEFYIVTVAGTTELDTVTSWSAGDFAVFYNGQWHKQHSSSGGSPSINPGQWTGIYGPNITSIDCEVGTGGATTTYTMRTFTPVFGRFTKANADRFKKNSRNLATARKNLALQILANTLKQPLNVNKYDQDKDFKTSVYDGGTEYTVLVGSLYKNTDTDIYHASVGLNKVGNLNNDMERYEYTAYTSLDMLFRPVSKNGSGGLPEFYKEFSAKMCTLPPEPPAIEYTPMTVGRDEIDPLKPGHDIAYLGRDDALTEKGLYVPFDPGANEKDDYRTLALKGPLLLQAYGLDTDNKPVPNATDIYEDAKVGIFNRTGLTDEFYPDVQNHIEMCPIAPIDLRLDRDRGVWTIPPSHRMVIVEMKADLEENKTAIGKVINGRPLVNGSGVSIQDETRTITVKSIGQKIKRGKNVMCYYDPSENTYYALGVGSSMELYLGKAKEDCTPWTRDQHGYVNVYRMQSEDLRTSPEQEDVVTLLRRKWHQADISRDDMIVYHEFSGQYYCLSDYSREVDIVIGTTRTASQHPDFGAFFFDYTHPVYGGAETGYCHNEMKHPVAAGTTCIFHRKEKSANSDKFVLLRATHKPYCVLTYLNFYSSPGAGTVTITVKDRQIYLDTESGTENVGYSDLYQDLKVYCCSDNGTSSTTRTARVDAKLKMNMLTTKCTPEYPNGPPGQINTNPAYTDPGISYNCNKDPADPRTVCYSYLGQGCVLVYGSCPPGYSSQPGAVI